MNVNFDTEKNRLHEIFHTFGFEHPKMKGGSSGIMCYPPRSPNAKDAQHFASDLLNDVLPFIKKKNEKNIIYNLIPVFRNFIESETCYRDIYIL